MGWRRGAQRRSTVLVVHAMLRAVIRPMTMMRGIRYIYCIILECQCIHPRGFHTTRTMTFSKRASPEDVAHSVLLFSDSGCAITFWVTSENISLSLC